MANILNSSFDDLNIYSFKKWDLFLHPNQYPYIGRCYAWAKRSEAKSLLDMNREERKELFEIIIPAWDKAISKLFNYTWPNFTIFGNSARHLHAHLIPRYDQSVIFEGIKFIDQNPKGNYSPYTKKDISSQVLQKIKLSIQELIDGQDSEG